MVTNEHYVIKLLSIPIQLKTPEKALPLRAGYRLPVFDKLEQIKF
jgi:hypothetical protein